ncbi:MAG: hypothetical protein U1A16_01945 [Patescibacteria group bacterium]|nr:hypothetical protein [Patescibacteria group bacterium]
MNDDPQKQLDELKKQVQAITDAFNLFVRHTHNGYDSTRVNFKDIVGEYPLFKNKRPIL